MAGLECWIQLALLDRDIVQPKEQKPVDFSVFQEQKYFRRTTRIQELVDRADEISSMSFFSEEEVQKILNEIEIEKHSLIFTESNNKLGTTDTDWKELAIGVAKDLLIPDEIDIALFLMTGPIWPTLSKIAKVPKALSKLIAHIPPKAREYLWKSIDMFYKEWNPEPLNTIAIWLRKTKDPMNHELAEHIENTITKKVKKSVPEKEIVYETEKKIQHKIKPEPKASELTQKEIELYSKDTKAFSWFENDLSKIYIWGMHEWKKWIETLFTVWEQQLQQFEKFIVYQRDIKKIPIDKVNDYITEYLKIFNEVIKSYWKWNPQLKSIEEVKKYLANLKNPWTH